MKYYHIYAVNNSESLTRFSEETGIVPNCTITENLVKYHISESMEGRWDWKMRVDCTNIWQIAEWDSVKKGMFKIETFVQKDPTSPFTELRVCNGSHGLVFHYRSAAAMSERLCVC